MKHLLRFFAAFILIFLLNFHTSNAQDFEAAKNISLDYGLNVLLSRQGMDATASSYAALSGAYFFDLKNGIRFGYNHYFGYDNSRNGFAFPVYYGYRTKSKVREKELVFDTFADFLTSLLGSIFPSRAEFNIGPVLGYIKPEKSAGIYDEEYKLTNKFFVAANARGRFTFQIKRINLGICFGLSYIPTKNFYYVSSTPFLNGEKTFWSLDGAFTLGYSFD